LSRTNVQAAATERRTSQQRRQEVYSINQSRKRMSGFGTDLPHGQVTETERWKNAKLSKFSSASEFLRGDNKLQQPPSSQMPGPSYFNEELSQLIDKVG